MWSPDLLWQLGGSKQIYVTPYCPQEIPVSQEKEITRQTKLLPKHLEWRLKLCVHWLVGDNFLSG